MNETRTIAGADFVATTSREAAVIGRCFDCDERIYDTEADQKYAVVTPDGRLFCSGECALWCAVMHDAWMHGLTAREVEGVSYWI